MLKISIRQVGKTKERALDELVSEFYKRLGPFVDIEVKTVKKEADLWEKLPSSCYKIVLDQPGKAMDSQDFAAFIDQRKNQGDSHLVFFIGPAEGFTEPPEADLLLSLSPMTFSHQTIRLLLAEQLYRAFMILEGRPFPK